jgi:hypothetical protein
MTIFAVLACVAFYCLVAHFNLFADVSPFTGFSGTLIFFAEGTDAMMHIYLHCC